MSEPPRPGEEALDESTGQPVWWDGTGWSYTQPEGPKGWTESGRPGDVHTIGGGLTNVVTSAGDLAGDIYQTVRHPIETVKGLSRVVTDPDARRAVAEFYKQRYGGLSNIADTLYHDPAGMAADASVVLRGLGAGAKVAGLTKAADVAKAAGNAVDPIQRAIIPVARGMEKAGTTIQKRAPAMMRSALKVRPTLEHQNPGVNFAELALKEGTQVGNEQGITKVGGRIADLENRIGQTIAPSKQAEAPVDILQKGGNLRGWQAERSRTRGADPKGLKAALKREEEFLADPAYVQTQPDGSVLRGVLPMPIQTMQESKVRLGNVLSQQFGKPMPGQTVEAGQKLRMDLKDRIAALEPGVAPLNQEVGPLYALEQALKERGEVFGRQNILPMRAGIGSWVFGASPNNLRHVIGAMLGMSVDDPRVLSRAAIAARPFGEALFKGGTRTEDFSRAVTPLSRAGEVGALAPDPSQITEEALRRALLEQMGGPQ